MECAKQLLDHDTTVAYRLRSPATDYVPPQMVSHAGTDFYIYTCLTTSAFYIGHISPIFII